MVKGEREVAMTIKGGKKLPVPRGQNFLMTTMRQEILRGLSQVSVPLQPMSSAHHATGKPCFSAFVLLRTYIKGMSSSTDFYLYVG